MGGGSTQITSFNADFDPNAFSIKGAKVIKTALGSATFSNYLKDNSTNKNINPINSINPPQNAKNYVDTLLIDAVKADIDLNTNFDKLFVNKTYYVIGGILSRAAPDIISNTKKEYKTLSFSEVKNVLNIVPILKADIKENADILYKLDDNELIAHGAEIGIREENRKEMASNILLIESYMDSSLKINEIYPVKIDGTDTIMINPEFSNEAYWQTDNVNQIN